MNTVFPVEVEILNGNGQAGSASKSLLQAFTRDVSEGGLCLQLKSFGKAVENAFSAEQIRLRLVINPTFTSRAIQAVVRVVWVKKVFLSGTNQFFIGAEYEVVDPADRRRIILYARRVFWLPFILSFIFLSLAAGLGGLWFHNQVLLRENSRLVGSLRDSADAKSKVTEGIARLDERRRDLETSLAQSEQVNQQYEVKIQDLSGRLSALAAENESMRSEVSSQKAVFDAELSASRDRESLIRAQLAQIKKSRKELQQSYQSLEKAGSAEAQAVLTQMVAWLGSHVNRRTGLVNSFEGDPALEDVAFLYDQALAIQVMILSGEWKGAERILSFFDESAKKEMGGFVNAYDTLSGSVQEPVVHAGPNVWLGIAALQHVHRSGSDRFLPMASRIGDWLIRLQDDEGGLPGGPKVTWYSTEHQLDAYAFFGMLYAKTGSESYRTAQQRVLEWIKKYAYSNRGGRVNRGKGDATIATDTFAWSISAVGPRTLKEHGFDPVEIMDFAEKNCEVSVAFQHPNSKKTISLNGFDFAKAQHVGRGGVVSTEWTAQMVVSYQGMSRFFRSLGDAETAQRYEDKANFYLTELQKMLITSPSRVGKGKGCMPYASSQNVDTGHGWRTPMGSSTGSVAGTAYSVFAWNKYNPFELEESNA